MALSTALSLQMPLTALASTGQNQSEGLEAHAGISSSDESSTTEIAVYPKEPLPYSLGEVKTIQMPANEFVIREAYRLDLDHGSTLTIKASGWNHHDSYSALALFSAADYDSFNKSAEVPFEKAIFVQNRTADDVSYSLPLSKGQYVLLFASGNGSGDAGSVQLTMTAKYKIMHRLYNSYTGEHFYTASASERDGLVAAGWTYEGVGWAAPDASGTPVYRLYNPYAPGGDHHYTMSASERDSLVEAGWEVRGSRLVLRRLARGRALPPVQPLRGHRLAQLHRLKGRERLARDGRLARRGRRVVRGEEVAIVLAALRQ